MQHYTTIEQSKKLVELGLNPDTADMCIWESEGKLYVYVCKPDDINCIPCWSLGALLEVMPKGVQINFNYIGVMIDVTFVRNRVIIDSHHVKNYTFLDAAFEMVCWLLENGYIKKGN